MSKKVLEEKYRNVYTILDNLIKEPVTELNYSSEFELLIAVMLSAQCTDKRVNIITDKLFKVYNTPYQYANLTIEELEKYISSCNFYHNKAKNIISMSKMLVSDYNGVVPSNHKDLVKLPGVGNKTANVMLAVAFNIPAFPVDTHVFRVCNRLGLTKASNVLECEKKMTSIYPKEVWGKLHHLILLFGRYYCKAIKPACQDCVLSSYCKYIKNAKEK